MDPKHVARKSDGRAAATLRVSFWDGVFASGMLGFSSDYLTPFVLLMGGTPGHVGILNALQNGSSALAQLKSADWTARLGARRPIINNFVFLQALTLLAMAGVAHACAPMILLFMGLVVLFSFFGAMSLPAWMSLMSDIVEEHKRGTYFGWRNRVLGPIMVGCSLGAGLFLNFMHGGSRCLGFAILFGTAGLLRIASWIFLTRMHEPAIAHTKEYQFTLGEFLKRTRESNFVKFVFFVAAMNFSVNLASPFFAVFMLRDLHFSYALYAFITVTATLTMYVAMGRWGRLADRCGNLRVLKATAPLIGFVPLLWVINQHPLFLIFAQLFSGFVWGGFNICAGNYIFDAVSPEKRTRCVGFYNFFNGLSLALGGLLGGFLQGHLPALFGYHILSLLVLSAFFRFLVGFVLSLPLKEVRPVEAMSSGEFLRCVIVPKV
jgi:MFS family permease